MPRFTVKDLRKQVKVKLDAHTNQAPNPIDKLINLSKVSNGPTQSNG